MEPPKKDDSPGWFILVVALFIIDLALAADLAKKTKCHDSSQNEAKYPLPLSQPESPDGTANQVEFFQGPRPQGPHNLINARIP